jgi:hypothetical protein
LAAISQAGVVEKFVAALIWVFYPFNCSSLKSFGRPPFDPVQAFSHIVMKALGRVRQLGIGGR